MTRAIGLKAGENCGQAFPAKLVIEGKTRSLYHRRLCLVCSPFGAHNTSKSPPGLVPEGELASVRRHRRNANTYRYQKRKRRSLKADLVEGRGGCCESCGYARTSRALEFHHRDAGTKEFPISRGSVSRQRLFTESRKCELLCANCHRGRHLHAAAEDDATIVVLRRERKEQAVALFGSLCQGCRRSFPSRVFEFHHVDALTKGFAISADGILRPWELIVAELEKCVLLCANCHREVHAGVRELFDDGLLGLADPAGPYVAVRPAPSCLGSRGTLGLARTRLLSGAQRIPVSAWSATSM